MGDERAAAASARLKNVLLSLVVLLLLAIVVPLYVTCGACVYAMRGRRGVDGAPRRSSGHHWQPQEEKQDGPHIVCTDSTDPDSCREVP